jgi:glycosyltransferase involved in cell wall biosynthesis
MKIIAQQRPDVRLVIVGDGPQRAELQHLIEDLGLTQHVSLLGHISNKELVSLYQSSWLLTSASHSEGWGMTITEAAACGTPCVVLDNDGHRGAVKHNVSGLIVPTLDDLGLAMLRVLLEPPLQKTLSDGALTHAESLTWDTTDTRTLGVLLDETKRQRTR